MGASLRGRHRRTPASRPASARDGRARAHLRQARRAAGNSLRWRAGVWPSSIAGSANDVFNEVGWLDPSGHLVRLIEARTFSPVKQPPELAVRIFPRDRAARAADRELAKQYWERLGFVGLDEPDAALPHVSCTSDSIDIGLVRSGATAPAGARVRHRRCRRTSPRSPGEAGIAPSGTLPAPLRQQPAAMLTAPEGTPDPAREQSSSLARVASEIRASRAIDPRRAARPGRR